MLMVTTPPIEHVRRFTRAEYHRLGEAGFFEDEKVELLFGLVVPMSPFDRRGETIALLAFPDVTVDVAAILPPSA